MADDGGPEDLSKTSTSLQDTASSAGVAAQGDLSSDDQDVLNSDEMKLRGRVSRKGFTGQTCNHKILIDDKILEPGENVLTMEYSVSLF